MGTKQAVVRSRPQLVLDLFAHHVRSVLNAVPKAFYRLFEPAAPYRRRPQAQRAPTRIQIAITKPHKSQISHARRQRRCGE